MKHLWIFVIICLGLTMSVLAQEGSTISYGESFVGEFTEETSVVTVSFEGSPGDVIYVSALNNFVPVEITLFSPSGGQLAFVDDAYLENIELGSDGQYSIEFIRPEWSEDVGEFVAHVGLYTVERLPIEDDNTLAYEGFLEDAAAVQVLEVDMNADDIATVNVFGANMSLSIDTPSGENLIFEGVYDDPDVPLFQFPETGTYRISLLTAEPGGTEVSLFLYRHNKVDVTTGEAMTGQLEEDLPVVFAFDTVAGKMWDLNAILPEDGDRFLAIYRFDGRPYWQTQIYSDVGSGPNGQPRIRPFIPQSDGTYYIALWYDNWDTDYELYEYRLEVIPSTVLSLPNGSPLTGDITEQTGSVKYAYTGKAGDRLRVTFRNTGDEGAMSLTILSSEDEVLTFTGRDADVSQFGITLPLDGTYEFIISNLAYDTATTLSYEIMVEPME